MGVKLVEARKELWGLIAESTAWMEECQTLYICEVTLFNLSTMIKTSFLKSTHVYMVSTTHANKEA